ncbi:glycosyltransferase [Acidocella sp.]|uniref:glycosyltransferase n=1 Tax=Acidocella sp. TaxID=50710 RepID=UPI003D09324F
MSDARGFTEHELQTLAALRQAERLTQAEQDEALRLSQQWRSPLPDVLSAMYRISNFDWARQMSKSCDLPFANLREIWPDPELVNKADRAIYTRHVFLPWRTDQDGALVVAARNPDDPAIQELMRARHPDRTIRYAVTGKFDVIWAMQTLFDDDLSLNAREALYDREPELSAKTTMSAGQKRSLLALLILLLLGLTVNAHATLVALSALISALYAALFLFRGILTLIGSGRRVDLSVSHAEIAALRDADLPVFTVLVPMYRESEVLPILVASIRRLDYPRSKLDVKLVLESGDSETINAARDLGAEDLFEIIRVPDSQPKTKPKACNYALHFARGDYTVIFDAEDIPEPDQLKKVVALFQASPKNVACVQARLNYFNRDDNFLTRMFTLEYSHWFDYLLPGLHVLNIPIPLGGTSNHFRTEVLRELGAWDPYNVTEDADLGVRLTQAGYRVAVVNSTTFEEANGVLKSWINQRSRWIKGYMQTWLVHMRRPVQLYRRLGFIGFVGFQMFVGFPPFTALINPVLWLTFLVALVIGPEHVAALFPPAVLVVALFDLLISNAMYVYFNLVAASKRQWFNLVPWGLLAPGYWVLHSVAAYKALGQLITNPHYWEKTQHGTSAQTREKVAALALGDTPKPGAETM